jgi:hypothetical protein
MAVPSGTSPLTLQQLLDAVDHLPPSELRELELHLAARLRENGKAESDEASLVRAATACLPAQVERRLRTLINRSERALLARDELAEYQPLAQEVQQLDAERAEALAELARRRGKSVRAVKADIGFESGTNGA